MEYKNHLIQALIKPVEIWDLDDMGELWELDKRFSVEDIDICCYQAYPIEKDYSCEPLFEDERLDKLTVLIDRHIDEEDKRLENNKQIVKQ